MRPESYIQQAVQLESCDFKAIASRLSNIETIRLLHAAIGIETEAGEFLDAMKKHIFYDRAPDLVKPERRDWRSPLVHRFSPSHSRVLVRGSNGR